MQQTRSVQYGLLLVCSDAGQGRCGALALTNLIFQARGLPVFSSFQDARRAFELSQLPLNFLATV
jgi:hypothetical protein